MIEIICKDDPAKDNHNKDTICLPKNIRQEGSPRGRHKIYLEDYVYTYLRNMAKEKEACAAVFLGKSQVEKDIRYTFISGLVECGAAVFQWDAICLDDSFWDYIYKEEKQYFPELEVVGWFLGKAGQTLDLSSAVEGAHRKYFSGRDKVLMLMDILEEEERFFVYEQGYLQKREGYYIYYEKNLPMQEYMICKREEELKVQEQKRREERAEKSSQPESEDLKEVASQQKNEARQLARGQEQSQQTVRSSERDARAMLDQMRRQEKRTERKIREGSARQKPADQKIFSKNNRQEPKSQAEEALEAYRRMVLERQGKSRERQNRKLLYTASSFFLVVICVIGITTINNYRKMQEVEEVLRLLNPGNGGAGQINASKEDGLVVETIESQVAPLEDNKEVEPNQAAPQEKPVKEQENLKEEGNDKEESKDQEDSKDQPQQAEEQEDKPKEPQEDDQEDPSEDKPENESQDRSAEEVKDDQADQNEAQETAAQSGEPRYYTVKPGDTLNTICLRIYKSKDMAEAIKKANGIEDGDKIYAGQKLLLP